MKKKNIFIPILSVILLMFGVACSPHSENLAEYKDFAKDQIASYVQESGFHKELNGFIYEILDECVDQIDLSDSKEEIDDIVKSGKETIIKTYKDFAKNQIISQTRKFNPNENFSEAIDEILNKSISQIDSASNKKEIDFQMNLALTKIGMQIKRVIEFDHSIEFESKRYDNNLFVNSTQNKIIRSIEELDKLLEDMIPEENYSAFEIYDKDFFNENALIFCLYWESDGSIQRRVENIYISEGKAIIEIMGIVPEEFVSSDGSIALNDDVYFRFYIIKVKQSDVENIKDVELFHTFTVD